MSKYYQKALDIISTDQDWKAICVAIAKTHPSVLCKAVGAPTRVDWELEAIQICAASGKVPAIKFIRSKTGLGLKESKDTIEALIEPTSF